MRVRALLTLTVTTNHVTCSVFTKAVDNWSMLTLTNQERMTLCEKGLAGSTYDKDLNSYY